MYAGDQLSNPLVDFYGHPVSDIARWGSTLKPPGRLLKRAPMKPYWLGINSQTPW